MTTYAHKHTAFADAQDLANDTDESVNVFESSNGYWAVTDDPDEHARLQDEGWDVIALIRPQAVTR